MAGKKKTMKDPVADKEKAEGERETVDEALKNAQDDGGGAAQAGITNRPLEEEEQEQRELPPRGHARSED